jgi:FkbM family methyltransferase
MILIGCGWILARSECSFTELVAMMRNNNSRDVEAFRSRVSLQTTEAGLDLWSTPQGNMWTVHGEQMLIFLEWEQAHDIYEPAGHEVRRGDIVLDCGANIGVFTRKALSRGAALVVAIEPAPQTLNALRRNFDAEIRAGRVIVYPKGVWDRESELDLTVDQVNNGMNSVVLTTERTARKVRVPLTTIDHIVADLHLPRVDFIKMDIEGAEKPALLGGRDTIRRFRPRMSISTEHLPDDTTAIPALLKQIETRYTHRGCDCEADRGRVRPSVLAFDPAE